MIIIHRIHPVFHLANGGQHVSCDSRYDERNSSLSVGFLLLRTNQTPFLITSTTQPPTPITAGQNQNQYKLHARTHAHHIPITTNDTCYPFVLPAGCGQPKRPIVLCAVDGLPNVRWLLCRPRFWHPCPIWLWTGRPHLLGWAPARPVAQCPAALGSSFGACPAKRWWSLSRRHCQPAI